MAVQAGWLVRVFLSSIRQAAFSASGVSATCRPFLLIVVFGTCEALLPQALTDLSSQFQERDEAAPAPLMFDAAKGRLYRMT